MFSISFKLQWLFIICLCLQIFGKEECSIAPNQRNLVIFNDPHFDELRDTNDFIYELFRASFLSESTVILAQTSVWQRFLKGSKMFSELLKTLNREPLAPESDKFIFYSFGSSFVLILPKKYLESVNNDHGFNLNNFVLIDNPNVYKPLNYSSVNKMSVLQPLNKLFFEERRNCYSWNIIVHGHGSAGSWCKRNIIAGLDQNEFKRILTFFNMRVKTNLLMYTTCFGGSKASLIETYMTKGVPDTYNYPIVVRALGDALVYFIRTTEIQAEKLFNQLMKMPLCPSHLKDLAMLLYDFFSFELNFGQNLNDLLQIRWPHSTEFKPIPLTEIVTVSSELPERKSIYGTHIIESAIIIDKPYIPEQVTLGEKQKFESSIPGQILHYIKSIRVPQGSLESLLESFTSGLKDLPEEAPEKRYLIDRYEFGEATAASEVTNIMIVRLPDQTPGKVNREMYYVQDGIGYLMKWRSEKTDRTKGVYSTRKLTSKELWRYGKLFERKKSELAKEYMPSKPLGLSELIKKSE